MMATPGPVRQNYLEGTLLRDSLQDILTRESDRTAAAVRQWVSDGLDHVYFVGCGGSLAVQEPAKWLLDRFSPVASDTYSGWEFVTRAPLRLNERAAVALASNSGTTEEIIMGLRLAKQRGARTISFSKPDTPLSLGAATALTYDTPAVNLAKLLMAYLVAANVIRQTGSRAEGDRLLAALAAVPESLHAIKEASAERGLELATRHRDAKGFYVVGAGPLMGLAYQFAVCTLMEMQWLDAAALNAGEFRHGPFEIVDQGLKMIFLLGTDQSRPVTERAAAFARRHGADVVTFDLAELPAVDPDLAPFALNVALQQFAWGLAAERNHPLATRRYMWKVEY